MRILYVSGSSAGHLAPLVAVERAVRERHPEAESLFVCSQTEDDAAFLANENMRYRPLPLPRHPWRHPLRLLQSFRESARIIDAFKPDAVFSKGGVVSVPLCFVAHRKKIPIVLHESDAVMGRANRLVAKWATKVCLGFPLSTTGHWPLATSGSRLEARDSLVVTGNPIRAHVLHGSRKKGLEIAYLSGNRPVLLVIGGSQGAQALNDAVFSHIDALLRHMDIVHVTGKGKRKHIEKRGYWSVEFAHAELPHLYAIASLALSRAGAGTIGELAANGIPTVLVPIEGLANNHQVLNAVTAQQGGGCIVLPQHDLADGLVPTVTNLMADSARLSTMSKKIRDIYHPEAARRIANIVAECLAPSVAND